jgi:hypothetical protein
MNPTSNSEYWDTMGELIVQKKIKYWRMFGMDKIGFMMGYAPRRRVVGSKGQRIQHDQGNANCEMVTVINTICADGTCLKPIVIYKGKNFLTHWQGQENPIEASYVLNSFCEAQWTDFSSRITLSENGWIDNELGVEYIRSFDEQTQDDTGEIWLLAIDSHESHVTDEFVDYAQQHDIEIACYIPHGTHAYQGLDVGVHGLIKTYWGQERNKLEEETGEVVTKDNFIEVYSQAHLRAMTRVNIQSAFQKTGLHPFNRNVITDEMMAPSLETSTAMESVFPMIQPGPVDTVLKALQHVNMPSELSLQGSNSHPTTAATPTTHRT